MQKLCPVSLAHAVIPHPLQVRASQGEGHTSQVWAEAMYSGPKGGGTAGRDRDHHQHADHPRPDAFGGNPTAARQGARARAGEAPFFFRLC